MRNKIKRRQKKKKVNPKEKNKIFFRKKKGLPDRV